MFSNAKVGDEVLCLQDGWTRITKVRVGKRYPIETSTSIYNLEGKMLIQNKHPTLFHKDQVPACLLELYPRPKKKVKRRVKRWVNVSPTGNNEPDVNELLFETEEEAMRWVRHSALHKHYIQVPVLINYEEYE